MTHTHVETISTKSAIWLIRHAKKIIDSYGMPSKAQRDWLNEAKMYITDNSIKEANRRKELKEKCLRMAYPGNLHLDRSDYKAALKHAEERCNSHTPTPREFRMSDRLVELRITNDKLTMTGCDTVAVGIPRGQSGSADLVLSIQELVKTHNKKIAVQDKEEAFKNLVERNEVAPWLETWIKSNLSKEHWENIDERFFRFFEEVAELAQALHITQPVLKELLTHVYSAQRGHPHQEFCGVFLTFAALQRSFEQQSAKQRSDEKPFVLRERLVEELIRMDEMDRGKLRIKQSNKIQARHMPDLLDISI